MIGPRRIAHLVRRSLRVARGRLLLAAGTRPVSRTFGYERGVPIHRVYVDRFFQAHAQMIRGRCLEFQDAGYVSRFGEGRPTRVDVLDLNASNPNATIVADLTQPNDLPADAFDCIVCVHVLHLVYDADTMTRELHRLLAPGGTLLVAVPGTSMIDPNWTEYRRWTALGIETLLGQFFQPPDIHVESYGNSLAAAAEMRGLASDEIAPWELNAKDDIFPVEIGAFAVKRRPAQTASREPAR
jgi:SAM-dependent methyltransferase